MLAAVALVAGCGRGADQARAAHEARTQARAGADRAGSAAAAANAAEADFVAAVSSTSSTSPVSLKFRIQQPPQVGVPLQLDLVLSQEPQLDITSMFVSLLPGDGLSVLSNRSIEYHAPPPGAVQRISVMLRADAPGVLSLSVTVLVDSANASVSRSFNIPLIAAPAGS